MNIKSIRLLIKASGLAAAIGVIAICALAVSGTGTIAAAAGDPGCAPQDGVKFICGISHPADMVVVPHTAWLITSSDSPQGGVFLVKADRGLWKRIFPGPDTAVMQNHKEFGSCSGPPAASNAALQGLALAHASNPMMMMGMATEYVLYAVNTSRNAVEVFHLQTHPTRSFGGGGPIIPAPRFSWVGCVALPSGVHASGIAGDADGTIYVSVPLRPGMSMAEENAGKPTGAVYAWKPGASGFQELQGTELAGNSGLAISPDGKTLYVAAAGAMQVDAFSVSNFSHPMHVAKLSGFRPASLQWDGNDLVTAGMRPGGGFVAARINPSTMQATVFEHGSTSGGFDHVSIAMPVAGHVFFGSSASGLGYRPMKMMKKG